MAKGSKVADEGATAAGGSKGKASKRPGAKAVARQTAKLEKRLAKARAVEVKRTRQLAEATADVARLTAGLEALRADPGEAAAEGPSAAEAPSGAEASPPAGMRPAVKAPRSTPSRRSPPARTSRPRAKATNASDDGAS